MTIDDENEMSELYWTTLYETLSELAQIRDTGVLKRQYWTRIKAPVLIRTWNSFIKLGFIRHPKIIDSMIQILKKNTVQLDINTMLLGHTSYYPEQDAIEFGFEQPIYEIDDEYINHYFLDIEEKQLSLSDYGLSKLYGLLNLILDEPSYEQKLVLIDRFLNVIHMRGDLALFFVEGGSETLFLLSNKNS